MEVLVLQEARPYNIMAEELYNSLHHSNHHRLPASVYEHPVHLHPFAHIDHQKLNVQLLPSQTDIPLELGQIFLYSPLIKVQWK